MSSAIPEWRARIEAVRGEIAGRARRAGRDPRDVSIIAVTKTLPPAAAEAAAAAGVPDVGESYVQEARAKRAACAATLRWHLIGKLQRNKVRLAVSVFDRIHSLDSPPLAEALSAAAVARGMRLPVLLQVNTAPGRPRTGATPEAAPALAEHVLGLPGMLLDGLMTVAPVEAAGEGARGHFRLLRELRDTIARRLGVELPHLSMGMSDDFAAALEEGATMLRLGRMLFGVRGSSAWREGS